MKNKMSLIIKCIIISLGVFAFSLFYQKQQNGGKRNPILIDLQDKLKQEKRVYSKNSLIQFEKTINVLVEEKTCNAYFARIDFKSGRFYPGIIFGENKLGKDIGHLERSRRVKTLVNFLNNNIIPKLKTNMFFSFYIVLDDVASLPAELLAKIDISSVPILMSDLTSQSFAGELKSVYNIPDLYIIHPSYFNRVKRVRNESAKTPFEKREDIAIWRGSQTGGCYNMETKNSFPRYRLVEFSLKNPTYVDARFTNHLLQVEDSESGKAYIEHMDKTFGKDPSKYFIKFQFQTKYKYVISLDGNVSTWGKIIEALNMGSVLLYNTKYVQFFSPYLKENVHYIPIADDCSDLKEKIDYLRANPQICKTIIRNAQEFAFNYIDADLISNYYAEVLNKIAISFEK